MKRAINREKTGGRKKGTPNKQTKFEREFIQEFLDQQTDKIAKELNSLHGESYMKVILSLLDFTLPKPQRIEFNAKEGNDTQLKDLWFSLMEQEFRFECLSFNLLSNKLMI